jgi:hypothetical protein
MPRPFTTCSIAAIAASPSSKTTPIANASSSPGRRMPKDRLAGARILSDEQSFSSGRIVGFSPLMSLASLSADWLQSRHSLIGSLKKKSGYEVRSEHEEERIRFATNGLAHPNNHFERGSTPTS